MNLDNSNPLSDKHDPGSITRSRPYGLVSPRSSPALVVRYGISVCAIFVVTAILIALGSRINATTVALALLLVVLTCATFFGRNPALIASLVAMLCYNFFFFPPVHTWTISDPQNLIAWAAFTVTAITAGELSAFARRRMLESERLYEELQSVFETAAQAEALKQSEKLKSALLDAITHDLRTPLTSIKASVTTLLESEGGHRTIELDADGRAEFLDIINEETDRLNHFIEGIVEIARVETAAADGGHNASDAGEIIASALDRAVSLTRDHRIETDIEARLPPVDVDTRAIAEVVYNVIENAVKYSPAGSAIKVSAYAGPDIVNIAVNDEGVGISEEMREKVFAKFVRIDKSPDGLGLGLSIAKAIVEAQSGSIRIEAGERRGTRVVVTLPCKR